MSYTTINKSSLHMNTKLYTGTGADNNAITGINFQPDLVWVKGRSEASSHRLNDAVRGAGKEILTNTSGAEYTYSPNTSLKSFNSDGFTLGTDNGINKNTITYASWNWKANGAGSANTDGTISSTVSVNQTAGFSIVSYTGNATAGATIGHGLGSAPSMIIAKRRSAVENWGVYHQSMGASKYINLDTTTAEQSSTSRWNGTEPTSSVFSVNTHASVNGNGDTYIAYCFAEKKGYSKFGSYTGNGSADGTFVYTGFKPAWVLIKRTDGTGTWCLFDNRRGVNGGMLQLHPNTTAADSSANDYLDILSNGFKCRNTATDKNNSGSNYIYMAFAEAPLVGTNNVPCTAR